MGDAGNPGHQAAASRSAKRFRLPPGTAWVTYIRCHDDIGWGFADEDAAEIGINGADHRRFLNDFFTGRFPGSFANGLAFQENPRTGDARISGMAASLCGLEKGGAEADLAIARLIVLYGVIMTIGGLPLIYLGDEVALTNDMATAPTRTSRRTIAGRIGP